MSYKLSWSHPDLTALTDNLTPAPAFPVSALGGLAEYCAQVARSTGAPDDYVAASLLTTAAALIGNTRRANNHGHSAPACLWTIVVGDPSTRKSPAMAPFRDYLAELEMTLSEQEQLVLEDVTGRAAKEAVRGDPDRLIVVADELRLFGKATTGADEGFWNKAYDGSSFSFRRKDTYSRVRNLNISILAAGQPDVVRSVTIRKDDSGFAARFLYVYPERPLPSGSPFTVDDTLMRSALDKLLTLRRSDGAPVAVPLSSDAMIKANDWTRQNDINCADGSGLFYEWRRKQNGMLLRYGLIFEFLWWATRGGTLPTAITLSAISAASEFIDNYATPMAVRALDLSQKTKQQGYETALARLLVKHDLRTFEVRNVYRAIGLPDTPTELRNADNVKAACVGLEEACIIRPQRWRDGDGAGKSRNAYEVNPLLLTQANITPVLRLLSQNA